MLLPGRHAVAVALFVVSEQACIYESVDITLEGHYLISLCLVGLHATLEVGDPGQLLHYLRLPLLLLPSLLLDLGLAPTTLTCSLHQVV